MPSDIHPKANDTTLWAIKELQFPQNLKILTSQFYKENASEASNYSHEAENKIKTYFCRTSNTQDSTCSVFCLSYYDN